MKFVHTADTHLGFEVTRTPQADARGRRSRAEAIYENFRTTVRHALEIEAELYIHSGDLFNKYYIPREKLDGLIGPIRDLSRRGVRVLIIPGNHERSQFPFDLFHGAGGVCVFDRPKSLVFSVGGYQLGVAGFPFIRENSRRTFVAALELTEYAQLRTDLNFLLTHQAFDQAVVGPAGFVFRAGRSDTVERSTVPLDFDYVAAGHIHRRQLLCHPLKPGVVFAYPGSVQRISFAEKDEDKGFIEGEIRDNRVELRFVPLPVHEMESVEIDVAGLSAADGERAIRDQFWRFDKDRVLRFKLTGAGKASEFPAIDFDRLRAEMPPILECQFALCLSGRRVFK